MNPHCLMVGWDMEEMGPYRPSCCGVGYFETIQIQGVLLAADDCRYPLRNVGLAAHPTIARRPRIAR